MQMYRVDLPLLCPVPPRGHEPLRHDVKRGVVMMSKGVLFCFSLVHFFVSVLHRGFYLLQCTRYGFGFFSASPPPLF